MRKILLLPLLLLLAACAAAAPTAQPAPVEEQATPEITEDTAVSAAGATTPEQAAVVRDTDWVKGAAEPVVSIIEYGDFQ